MTDLHVHSVFSDGELTPEELVERAGRVGVRVMALTDHDTTEGVPRFLAACLRRGIDGIAGIELSAECPGRTLHMLGYGIDPGEPRLQAALTRIREGREKRNVDILRKLEGLGLVVSMERVRSIAGGDVVGRPHIAKALIEAGQARDMADVFERLLGKGKPAYCERFRFSPEECIRLIRGAGGAVALAHPVSLQLPARALRRRLSAWMAVGLTGLEVCHSDHSERDTARFRAIASDMGLVVTGGSDFHGTGLRPKVELGSGSGSLRVPEDCADKLRATCPTGPTAAALTFAAEAP